MGEEKLYIIGAGSVGGHIALNIHDYSPDYKVAGFLDDDPDKIDTEQFGYPVIGNVDYALNLGAASIVFGIAYPIVKMKLLEQLIKNKGLSFPSLLHNKAWISEGVQIGEGSVIYPGTSINYGSKIGNFVVMNMNCALGHHTRVGDYSSLAPGVNTGGHTEIGTCVEVGIGVSTLQNVYLGDESIIGGQSMVTRSVPRKMTVTGVPARIRKTPDRQNNAD